MRVDEQVGILGGELGSPLPELAGTRPVVVGTDRRPYPPVVGAVVLLDELPGTCELFVDREVPEQVGDCRAEKSAQASLTEDIRTETRTSIHRIHRRDPAGEKVQRRKFVASLAEIVELTLGETAVEGCIVPPQLELTQFAGTSNRRGKFEMRVRVDQARHDQFPRSIDDHIRVQLGVAGLGSTHLYNPSVLDSNRTLLVQFLVVVDCQHECIVDDDVVSCPGHITNDGRQLRKTTVPVSVRETQKRG